MKKSISVVVRRRIFLPLRILGVIPLFFLVIVFLQIVVYRASFMLGMNAWICDILGGCYYEGRLLGIILFLFYVPAYHGCVWLFRRIWLWHGTGKILREIRIH